MQKYNILLTCPPMILQTTSYTHLYEKYNFNIHIPDFKQTMTEDELVKIIPQYDGWIIGDDPATMKVFKNGTKLKGVVKWGVGVDNVDFQACQKLNIPVTNTPNMFGQEVSDIAVNYLLGLARQTFKIHENVKKGLWIKPCGESLYNKKVCLVGFGDIGKHVAKKLLAFDMKIHVSDPFFIKDDNLNIHIQIDTLDNCLTNADYVVITCSLNKSTFHLINKTNLLLCKNGVKVINVSRGSIVNENDIIELLESGHVNSVAFDVYENEPVDINSKLLTFDKNIFGSHNSSNTKEAVDKTSERALFLLSEFINNSLTR